MEATRKASTGEKPEGDAPYPLVRRHEDIEASGCDRGNVREAELGEPFASLGLSFRHYLATTLLMFASWRHRYL